MIAGILSLLGVVLSLGCLGGWYYTQPGDGSGYLLFASILTALVLRDNIRPAGLNVLAQLLLVVGFGGVWYLSRTAAAAPFLLLGTVLSILALLQSILDALGKTGETTENAPSDNGTASK